MNTSEQVYFFSFGGIIILLLLFIMWREYLMSQALQTIRNLMNKQMSMRSTIVPGQSTDYLYDALTNPSSLIPTIPSVASVQQSLENSSIQLSIPVVKPLRGYDASVGSQQVPGRILISGRAQLNGSTATNKTIDIDSAINPSYAKKQSLNNSTISSGRSSNSYQSRVPASIHNMPPIATPTSNSLMKIQLPFLEMVNQQQRKP